MRPALVLAAMLCAGGCATTTDKEPTTAVGAARNVDEARMQQVENVAAQRGVRIQWVNPPRKPEQPSGS